MIPLTNHDYSEVAVRLLHFPIILNINGFHVDLMLFISMGPSSESPFVGANTQLEKTM